MIQLSFTNEEIEQLHYERFHHPPPHVQRKMEALYLKSHKPTLLSYFRDYQTGGIAKLKELTFYRPQSELKQHQKSLDELHPDFRTRG